MKVVGHLDLTLDFIEAFADDKIRVAEAELVLFGELVVR